MEDGIGAEAAGVAGMAEPAARFVHRRVRPQAPRPFQKHDLDALAHAAAFGLCERHPQASAGRPLRPPWPVLLGPAAFVSGTALCAPGTSAAILAALFTVLVAASLILRLAAALFPPAPNPRRELDRAALPAMSVIVALHDEAAVIAGLARSLAALDYPRDRLEIVFAIEADDEETLDAARALARKHAIRVLPVPGTGPRTKPKALNLALRVARGELVAIYDAEDAPAPDQLRAAAEAFAADRRLACVQAPLGWYNGEDNWLTRQFALEYAVQFRALVPILSHLGWPVPLGGTSNVFRRIALEAAGGWDPFNVTEDADLGFRLVRAGWTIGWIAPATLEEAPISLGAWCAQRSRWLKGHLVSWLVQMRDPRGLARAGGAGAHAALHLTLGWNVLSALLHLPCLGVSLAILLAGLAAGTAPILWMGLLPGAYLTAMLSAALAARRAGIAARTADLVTMPAYWLLQGPAMVRALAEIARGDPHLWAKTEHGLSPARRAAGS
ncbi:glycosyltransferase [Marinicauda algicola]|uniref:Glycosyltransferase n=1 Tax=Marinicauda algicola TaxID=2029849 RepID=A0A4S2GYD4_9PROT|nr:glycosyltransferase [Marinicauda algicola]TGY88126.1 glycosyltransferase [Marinicauda algicola]